MYERMHRPRLYLPVCLSVYLSCVYRAFRVPCVGLVGPCGGDKLLKNEASRTPRHGRTQGGKKKKKKKGVTNNNNNSMRILGACTSSWCQSRVYRETRPPRQAKKTTTNASINPFIHSSNQRGWGQWHRSAHPSLLVYYYQAPIYTSMTRTEGEMAAVLSPSFTLPMIHAGWPSPSLISLMNPSAASTDGRATSRPPLVSALRPWRSL